MPKILILYYSKNGSTLALAQHIAKGVELENCEAILRTVPPIASQTEHKPVSDIPDVGHLYVSKQDLMDCDGLALGSPTHFGNMASPLKYFIDSLTDVWLKGSLIDKPACVFTSSSSLHGGQESTLLTMMLPLLHHGMMIMGLPYSEPKLHETKTGGTPYGVSHVQNTELSSDEVELCLAMGKRLANIVNRIKDSPK